MSNIINAIINLVNNPITDIKEYTKAIIERIIREMLWRNM